MTIEFYILIGSAALGMLLSYLTRVEMRGQYAMIGRRPLSCELLIASNLPCMVALAAWSFFVYPWWVALGGVLFFIVVFALVQGVLLAMLGGLAFLEKLSVVRPVLDLVLIVGAGTLWWRFYPL